MNCTLHVVVDLLIIVQHKYHCTYYVQSTDRSFTRFCSNQRSRAEKNSTFKAHLRVSVYLEAKTLQPNIEKKFFLNKSKKRPHIAVGILFGNVEPLPLILNEE